jgi:5'-nucleotidase
MTDAGQLIDRILITNDDGIDAPGLAVLAEVAATLTSEVWIVAPQQDQSGVSHSISLHDPLRCHQRNERSFAVSGTPADCVVFAVRHLMKDRIPGLLLSGINRGGNLGVETVFSGTVGAAMAGLLLNIPSMALSQTFRRGDPMQWPTSRALAPDVIRRLIPVVRNTRTCLNINFPAVSPEKALPLIASRQGAGLLDDMEIVARKDPRNLDYHWLQLRRFEKPDAPDSEAALIAAGHVTVTPLQFERTDEPALASLRQHLEA